jgi:hypothetical protein
MTTRNRELASIIDDSGNITTGGNLSVTGNLTQSSSTTTTYADNLLELNTGASSNSNDLGLVMERGSTGDNAIFLWDESNDGFAVGTTTSTGSATGNISFTAAPFTASTISGTILTGSTSVKTPLIEYTDGDDAITIADGGHITTGGNLSVGGSNNELRFYEGSNYVGFEAPALSADQIWVLPTADGSSGQILKTDGSGTLSFTDDLTLANASVNNYSGDGSTTGFTLSSTPVSENATQAYINGVYQFKNTYAVSGTTLTFDTAPANGASIEVLVWATVAVSVPADNSVTSAKLTGDLTLPGHLTLAASKEIRNASGDLTLDVAGDITLDADGGDWIFSDAGTTILGIHNVSSDAVLKANVNDKDMIFKGTDNNSEITALTLDMSDAGTATFNNTIKVSVDSDVVAEIGRAHVGGGLSGLSDYAVFSHLHSADSGGYALAQNASGATFLNADDGQDITFLAHGTSIATLASDASLTLTGDLVIPSTITHAGDTDTKLDFNQANTMRLITGDTTAWIANASSMVINEDSADFDFRVESNDSANMLFVDGGNNLVLIQANNTASVTNSATALAAHTLEVNGNAGEGSDNLSFFAMADGTGNYGMEVSNSSHTAQYDLLINPIMGGNVGIGTTSATSQLHIENSASNSVVQVGYKNDAQEWRMGVHGGVSDSFLLYDNTGGSTRLKVTTSGAISSTTGGLVLQTKEVYANTSTSISSGGTAVICSTTITVLANSKIAVWAHSGQIQNDGNGQNPTMLIQHVDSGNTVTNISDHQGNHYGWDASTHVERMFTTSQGISGALSAGTYTVRILGGAYNGTVTMNFQNQGSHMIIQEISAG